jgi:hypothetical protein
VNRVLRGSCATRRLHHPIAAGAVPALDRRPGELLEHLPVVVPEVVPLPRRPPLELGSARQVEPVEKPAAVERRRPLERALAPRGLELDHVGGHDRGVESEVLGPDDRIVPSEVAEVAAQRVEGLRQELPPALVVGVRPEQADHLLAGDPSIARARQEREHGQPPGLGRRAAERNAVTGRGQPSERVYPQ